MKQLLYVVNGVTNGTVNAVDLQDAIAKLIDFPIVSVEVVNFRVLPAKKAKS